MLWRGSSCFDFEGDSGRRIVSKWGCGASMVSSGGRATFRRRMLRLDRRGWEDTLARVGALVGSFGDAVERMTHILKDRLKSMLRLLWLLGGFDGSGRKSYYRPLAKLAMLELVGRRRSCFGT